ncbi:MAG: hypothetical protein R6X10_17295 [Desulfobacterales bacterium]
MIDSMEFQKNNFERKRDEILAFIYQKDCNHIEAKYKEVLSRVKDTDELSEIDQKALNQIQHAVKNKSRMLSSACKSNLQKIYQAIRKRLSNSASLQIKEPRYVSCDSWFRQLGITRDQFKVMLKTVILIQLSVGCSNFCRRCNEWALPGPRKHFTFDAVKKLIKETVETGNREFVLYSASDPLDWKHENRNITDIVEFMENNDFRCEYGFLTKVPRGLRQLVEKLLDMEADFAVSITGKNRKRIEAIEKSSCKRINTHHDLDELLIASRLDEDFESIKSSITDNYGTEITPEGAFLIVPAYTSALNPTGQARIPVTGRSKFFLKRKAGRDALPIEYFKPLQAVDLDGKEFVLDKLLDPQIESILQEKDSEDATPPGMMSFKEFFQIFEPDAVSARKKLIPAVVNELKEQMVSRSEIKPDDRNRHLAFFRKKVRLYVKFCRMGPVMEYKKNAISFYLRSIADYLRREPVRGEIVSHLRKKDRKMTERIAWFQPGAAAIDVEGFIEESGMETFDMMQGFISRLLDNYQDKGIQEFIAGRKAVYDSDQDRFVTL